MISLWFQSIRSGNFWKMNLNCIPHRTWKSVTNESKILVHFPFLIRSEPMVILWAQTPVLSHRLRDKLKHGSCHDPSDPEKQEKKFVVKSIRKIIYQPESSVPQYSGIPWIPYSFLWPDFLHKSGKQNQVIPVVSANQPSEILFSQHGSIVAYSRTVWVSSLAPVPKRVFCSCRHWEQYASS